MSITTHTSTIRQYVKNHTKDDIAIFFEHQFVAKDAEIERLKSAMFKCVMGDNNGDCHAAEVVTLKAEIQRLTQALADKDKALGQAIEHGELQLHESGHFILCGSDDTGTPAFWLSVTEAPELAAELEKRKGQ